MGIRETFAMAQVLIACIASFHRLIIISFGFTSRGRLARLLCVLSLSGLGLAGIVAIACLQRPTAGTSPCVFKHSFRAFHPNTHTGSLSALSARSGAWPTTAVTIVVGRRPITLRIKKSVLIEVFWFGRITSDERLQISLQMASGLLENFVGAWAAGWRIPSAWSRLCGQTTICTASCNTSPSLFDTLRLAADSHAAPKAGNITAIVPLSRSTLLQKAQWHWHR